jgi:hypothetical protein
MVKLLATGRLIYPEYELYPFDRLRQPRNVRGEPELTHAARPPFVGKSNGSVSTLAQMQLGDRHRLSPNS